MAPETKPRSYAGHPAVTALSWTVLFALFTLLRLAFHEMWRDELNVWTGAVDIPTLTEMISSVRYGGHGFLWSTLLHFLAKGFPDPLALQILHAAIATAAAWMILRYAPLSPWLARLLVFGYYFGFEYAVIARDYSLGILAVVTAIVLLTRAKPRILFAAVCLALAANTTIYGLILSLAVAAGWGVGQWPARSEGPCPRLRLTAGAAVLLTGTMAAIWFMYQPVDSGFAVPWHAEFNKQRLIETAQVPLRAFLPIPQPGIHFWNSSMFVYVPSMMTIVLGVIVVLLIAWRYRRNAAALICWTIGSGGLLTFAYLKHVGYLRHHGHVFLVFLAAAWLAEWEDRRRSVPAESRGIGRAAKATLWVVMMVQFTVGLYASIMDLRLPFSASKAAAEWICGAHLDGRLIIADIDYIATPVLARLDQPRMLYARARRVQRMILWNRARTRRVSERELKALVKSCRFQEAEPPVLLVTYPLTHVPRFLRLAKTFPPGIVGDEQYFLYVVGGKYDHPIHTGP